MTARIVDESSGPIHGLAMDLGTTTVVVRLINLETGELVADASFENPQRFGGSDVMSRIHYDTEHQGKLLRRTLAGYLTHAIEEFPVDPRTIYEVVVVGQFDDAGYFLSAERLFDRTDPVPLDHRDRHGGGTPDDDQPDRDGTPLPAADSSRGPRVRAADHQRTRRRRCRRLHARRRTWRTRIAWSRSWTSAPTRS